MPTKQETFDTVVAHLRKQGKQASEGGHCRYRTSDGLKCAAGCLIPDDKYSREFEGLSVVPGDDSGASAILRDEGHNLPLVRDLQSVHDRRKPDAWEVRLKEIADEYNLTYTPPT